MVLVYRLIKNTYIMVLQKSKHDNNTLFIDASKEYVRGGNKNKLSEANRKKILETFTNRQDIKIYTNLG